MKHQIGRLNSLGWSIDVLEKELIRISDDSSISEEEKKKILKPIYEEYALQMMEYEERYKFAKHFGSYYD